MEEELCETLKTKLECIKKGEQMKKVKKAETRKKIIKNENEKKYMITSRFIRQIDQEILETNDLAVGQSEPSMQPHNVIKDNAITNLID